VIAAFRPALVLLAIVAVPVPAAAHGLKVVWHPAQPRVGEVGWLRVQGAAEGAVVEGSVGDRPLSFFPYAGGWAALAGFDLDTKPGLQEWRVAAQVSGEPALTVRGRVKVRGRGFPVQRLRLPTGMVDLDPEIERRAESEIATLHTLYRTISPERLWRGRFTRPVAGADPGTGFGARRIINGQRRAPHGGIDYAAPRGTAVVAANDGRVALVADYFFPGRLVVIDHGLGLYTLYFHLDEVRIAAGEPVSRGQLIGAVGSTGRATGPHLHFGAHLGGARIDPSALLALAFRD
jgi:murein DD-endopeptidase MepM/ murein hydrolase activator NlpD